jgi:4'-phosphopantetheinyl transferase
MPILFNQIIKPSSKLSVWHITETEDFFIPKIEFTDFDQQEFDQITHTQKRLEWLASRHLVKLLLDKNAIIHLDKKASGKPIITNFDDHISISHSGKYAACICDKSQQVSIDIEQIDPRVLRIENKFLSISEKEFIPEERKIEYLILCWSAKETIFKYIERPGITFKEEIIIQPFELSLKGTLEVHVILDNQSTIHNVNYERIDDCFLTYICES